MDFAPSPPPPLVWENVINCNENKEFKSEIGVKDILWCYMPAIVYNLYHDQNVFTLTVSHIHVCNKICLNQLHLFIIIHKCTETIMILFYKHCDNSHTCYISLRIIQDKDYALIPCMYILCSNFLTNASV